MTALSALPAVGLEEISERAGRMTRVDRKYLVPHATAEQVLAGQRVECEVEGIGTLLTHLRR